MTVLEVLLGTDKNRIFNQLSEPGIVEATIPTWMLHVTLCRAPLLEECPQHHGHKGDPGMTPETCGAIGERAQVILVWVRAPGRWERLPPTETTSHEGKA